jgi:hypothetical protein
MGLPIAGLGTIAYRLSATELEVVHAVYTAGLRPGSTRAEFVARGLVNP